MENRIILIALFTFALAHNILEGELYKFDEINSIINIQKEANENITILLKQSRNEINFTENICYQLSFSNISYDPENQDILIYNNLQEVADNISQFDLFNESLYENKIMSFISKQNKTGFIDIKVVSKGEYVINKDIIREDFYKGNIEMIKQKEERKFFVNIIPTDNNSDLYFFQTNRDTIRDENKDRFNLYYFNEFKDKDLDQVIDHINKNPMKRERCINGKLEIFGYTYNNLDKNISISIGYKQIKGTGIVGPIISFSVLFAALVVVLVFFIKNTYFEDGYKNK